MSRIELLSQASKIKETLSSNNSSLEASITMDTNNIDQESLNRILGTSIGLIHETLFDDETNRNHREHTIDAFTHGLISLDELSRNPDISIQSEPWVPFGEEEEPIQQNITNTYRTFNGFDIVATFNGREIGRLDSIDYIVRRGE